MSFMQQLFVVILVFAMIPLVLKLLARAQILPFLLYEMIVGNIFPVWVEEHGTLHMVISALCIAYAVLYWVLKFISWRREEGQARDYLLATATPLYRTMPAMQQPELAYIERQPNMPDYEPCNDPNDPDYWYDR